MTLVFLTTLIFLFTLLLYHHDRQFGVGFYSTFLVADRVSVASRNPNKSKSDGKQYVWESTNGASEFLVYPDPRGETLGLHGTEITLYLKEDALEYADPMRLNELARHYSEFVTHPIYLRNIKTEMVVDEEATAAAAAAAEAEKTKEKKDKDGDDDDLEVGSEEDIDKDDDDKDDKKAAAAPKMKQVSTTTWDRINDNTAIWTRDKDNISDDEYQAFFHRLTDEDFRNASKWSHFNAEGNINFKSILYLPEDVPSSYRYGNMDVPKSAIRLYVQKVLISDEFALLPKYLGFIRGVVDSDDLPLNVNRETLQESKILKVIQKKVVRKAIDLIRAFAKEADDEEAAEKDKDKKAADDDADEEKPASKKAKYMAWYKQFAPNIKLGTIDDEPNRGKLSKLLRYQTSKSNGELKTLTSYVADMKEWQKEIYVMGGSNVAEIESSPLLEGFKDKDVEVIYMTDALDEYLVQHVREYDGKKFVQATSENVKFKDEDADLIKRREKAYNDKFKPLTKALRKLYQGTVLRVQVAKRNLGSVPAVVTSSDYGNTANMERILRAQAFSANADMGGMGAMKIFEINPRHPLIVKLLDGMVTPEQEEKDGDDDKKEAADPELPVDLVDSAMMIHDMAMLNGGFPIANPKEHNARMAKVLQKQFGLESLALEPEIDPPVVEDEPPEFDMDSMMGGGMNMEDFNMDDFDLDSLNMDEL
jgi:heat shock protein 90kDa beta